jgi:hypothetical protein
MSKNTPHRRADALSAIFQKRGIAPAARWVCTAFFTEAERQALLDAVKVEKGRAAGLSKDRTQALDAVLRGIQHRNPKLFRKE